MARAVTLSFALLAPRRLLAVDPFEIQVYDGTANAPGQPGLELHLNTVPNGRKSAPGPEVAPDRVTHLTLEPSFGMTPFWEIGGYFQTALRGDGTLTYAGIKLRSKFVVPFPEGVHYRLGVNVELSILPEAYDQSRFGSEIRPIACWENEHFIIAVNPIIDASLAAPDFAEGPSFEPALLAKAKIAGAVALGVEYYGNFGPIAHVSPWEQQEHYLYEVFDLLSVRDVELNAGVGEGLTNGSNRWTVKMIFGYVWDVGGGASLGAQARHRGRAITRAARATAAE